MMSPFSELFFFFFLSDNPYLITHTCIEWSLNPHPLGVGDFGERAAPLGQFHSGPILSTLIIHV